MMVTVMGNLRLMIENLQKVRFPHVRLANSVTNIGLIL